MSTPNLELRVGALVVTAAALLVTFVLLLGHVRLAKGFEVYADFAYAGTLQAGAAVKVSGVSVGQVTALTLIEPHTKPAAAPPSPALGRGEPPTLRATISLGRPSVALLHEDATFAVATQGVIGEAYLEMLGGHKAGAPSAGTAMRGVDAPRLYEMTLQVASLLGAIGSGPGPSGEAGDVASQVGQLVATFNGVLGSRGDTLRQTLDNVASTTTQLASLSTSLRRTLGEGRDLAAVLQNAQVATRSLRDGLPPLLQHSDQAAAAAGTLAQQAGSSFDPAALQHLLVEAKETMDQLKTTVADMEASGRTIRRGQGTLGALVQDPQLYDDIKELMRDLKHNPWKLLWKD